MGSAQHDRAVRKLQPDPVQPVAPGQHLRRCLQTTHRQQRTDLRRASNRTCRRMGWGLACTDDRVATKPTHVAGADLRKALQRDFAQTC